MTDQSTPEWQNNIINTGEKGKQDTAEKTAIAFVLEQKKAGMPKDRLDKLISAITKILEQKKHDTIDIKKECEQALNALESEISKKEIVDARESCFRNKFDPNSINGKKTAKYFAYLYTNTAEINAFHNEIIRNPELLAGFIRYWTIQKARGEMKPESNIIQILGSQSPAVTWIESYYQKLIQHYKINIKQGDSIADLQKKISNSGETSWTDSIFEVAKKGSDYVGEKTSNLMSEQDVKTKLGISMSDSLETNGFSDVGLHGFNKERGNFFVTISEFEGILKNEKDARKINSRALANYLTYLLRKNLLDPKTLLQKFGKDILSQLGKLWQNGGNPKEGGDSLIAYKVLQKNNLSYIIKVIDSLDSQKNILESIGTLKDEKEQALVLLFLKEENNSLREKFKQELKVNLLAKHPNMSDKEANSIIEKILVKVLSYEGVQGLSKIYQIFDAYSKEYGVEVDTKSATKQVQKIQKSNKQLKVVSERFAINNEKDSAKRQQLEKKTKKTEQELRDIEMAEKTNDKMNDSDIKSLTSGKKTIEQVVNELGEKDVSFAKEYKTWKKEKEQFDKENPPIQGIGFAEKNQIKTESTTEKRGSIPFHSIDSGKPYTLSLDRQSETSDMVTIRSNGDKYIVQVGDDTENTTELPKEKVSAYIRSLRFMEKLGLGYFIKHLSQDELSDVIKLTSSDTVRVNNKDGGFGDDEKKRIIMAFGNLLGIENIKQIHPRDAANKFQAHFFAHSSIESILLSKNILVNGTIKKEELKNQIIAS